MATLSTPPVSTALTSWEEFERLPDSDGFHRELIEGVLQILPPPKSLHTRIASRLFKLLVTLEPHYRVFLEGGYKLQSARSTWLQPDASVLSANRTLSAGDDYFLEAPELAVEIISPSESAAHIQQKVNLYLKSGSQAVWVIYPESRTVQAFAPDGTARTLSSGDKLTAPFLSVDWSAPVARLFED